MKANQIISKKFVIYAKKDLVLMMKTKNIIKSETTVIVLENIEELLKYTNLRYKTPKEIHVVFHNGSTYEYHFIIKELVKEFKGKFKCLGENAEKCIGFSVFYFFIVAIC